MIRTGAWRACSVLLGAGKRDSDGRLASLQTTLTLQVEEARRAHEAERKQLLDQIAALQRVAAGAERDKAQLQVALDNCMCIVNTSKCIIKQCLLSVMLNFKFGCCILFL